MYLFHVEHFIANPYWKEGENALRNNPVVTIIPATINRQTLQPLAAITKRRAAAYARVSTDSKDQENSYDAQKSVFEGRIKANPDWIFVDIYADKGLSGTGTKKRDGFNRMINTIIQSNG